MAVIEPLTLDESRAYIAHQFKSAGGNAEQVIDGESIGMLAEACHGVPRLLNRALTWAAELAASGAFLKQQMASYAGKPEAEARRLALADFCQAVLSLNEFIYVQ